MTSIDPDKLPGGQPDSRPDEDLLRQVLEGRAVDPADAAPWAEAVHRMRVALRSEQGLKERAPAPSTRARELGQRILAQTTREDLSWRGDLRLVGRFMGSGMRRSPLLRVAAASLLFHLAALPLLAYWAWRGPSEDVRIGFETHDRAYPNPPFPDPLDEAAGQLPVPGIDQEPVILDETPEQGGPDSEADSPQDATPDSNQDSNQGAGPDKSGADGQRR